MGVSSEVSGRGYGIGFDGRLRIDAGVDKRASPRTLQTAAAVSLVPMVVLTFWLALTSDHLQWPVASALYRSALVGATVVVGLCWWVRRPASRFGPLLGLLGIGTWVVTWQFSNVPLVFDIGVVAEGPVFVLVFFLFLAFPTGRVEPPAARWLVVALAGAVLGFYVLWALFSPAIYGVAPLTSCAPGCPENVLQIGSAGKAIEVVGKVESYVVLTIITAVFVIYAVRLRSASRPRRRALVAVAVTSTLYLLAAFAATLSSVILASSIPRRCGPRRGSWSAPGFWCRSASSLRSCRLSCSAGAPCAGSWNAWPTGLRPSNGVSRSPRRSTIARCSSRTAIRSPGCSWSLTAAS